MLQLADYFHNHKFVNCPILAAKEKWMPRGHIHHIDLTVTDLDRSREFYDLVLGYFGYVRVDDHEYGTDWDHRAGYPFQSIGIKIAQGENAGRPHDRYSAGLHHLAWNADSRADVDELHEILARHGVPILDTPAEYPRYAPGYYALFFADPDGLKLEYVFVPGQT